MKGAVNEMDRQGFTRECSGQITSRSSDEILELLRGVLLEVRQRSGNIDRSEVVS
jgi:hypothetical protein